VFRVTDIEVPKLDAAAEDTKRLVETLNRGLSEDVFSEYVARLENETGVTINQAALNQVITGGAATDEN
jgi:peptidyl-prolyl cis-trans isomerase D